MKINGIPTKWELEQTVYLRANSEYCGVVTGIVIRKGVTAYLVTWSDHEEVQHWDFELLAEKPTFEAP